MKRLALAILVTVLLAANGFSATVIRDPNVFYTLYGRPNTVLDFLKLKDGTTFDNIPDRYIPNTSYQDHPDNLILHTGKSDGAGGFELIAVRSQAFSDVWSFKATNPNKPGTFREAIVWFSSGITSGSNEMTISAASHQAQPFAIYTEKGFIGIVPSNPQETLFVFEDLHLISSFETGFSEVNSDAKPPRKPPFWEERKEYQRI
jgi:hypothetical protein